MGSLRRIPFKRYRGVGFPPASFHEIVSAPGLVPVLALSVNGLGAVFELVVSAQLVVEYPTPKLFDANPAKQYSVFSLPVNTNGFVGSV